ncbi:TRAP transporter large permease [Belnapia sp. T6]|uniref:TRAP transporter large permease protein n=1 Tax=Belnapia mucosa TaxID=2804532 RepID=A0ABS1V2J8_9PROT|nr:TRAP transporter large permease [Belnapia mucosa]MBL6455924.1 TRAP transporter large permease [Belnapia mucosa]
MTLGVWVLLAALTATLAIDVPVAFGLGLSALVYLLVFDAAPVVVVAQRMVGGLDSFPLLAIPLFLLAGNLMTGAGLTRRIADLCTAFVGHWRGGLGAAAVLGCGLFSALSGSSIADVVAIGGILLPAMARQGYPAGFSCALLGSAGTLGQVIPPSIVMVVYATLTNVSVGQLFLAGFIPGAVLAGLLMAASVVLARRHGWGAEAVPFSAARALQALRESLLALVVPVIIVGGIRLGLATPTEAAGLAVLYALLVGLLVERSMTARDIWAALRDAAEGTAAILLVIATASLFGWILAAERMPQAITEAITGWTDSRALVLLLLTLVLLLLGTFMEALATVIILAPVLMPLLAAYRIDPVHFGLLLIVNVSIGGATPPLGVNLMAACRVAGIREAETYRWLLPLLGVLTAGLLVMTYWEDSVMGLPRWIG